MDTYNHEKEISEAIAAGERALHSLQEAQSKMVSTYKEIPLDTYSRREHFLYFCSLPYPYMGVTVPVDVTKVVSFCKKNGHPFYLTMLHLAAKAANTVPEFRCRILDGRIIEYDFCPTSHTELKDDGTYAYCTVYHDHPSFDSYMNSALIARQNSREQGTITEDADVNSMFFVSTLPWLHYTTLIQPIGGDQHSNPRLSWGKFVQDANGNFIMPFSVLVHHGLVDGMHLSLFYTALEKSISSI